LPAILGIDLAGVVEQVGEGVRHLAVGDAVWAMAGGVGGVSGAMASYVVADASLVSRKPANLSMRQAAALPLAIITAWEGMVDNVNVQAGEKVLVIGAAGGVGHVAVQLALARGAAVFGVAGADGADYLRSLGATFIERDTPVEQYVAAHTDGRGFDVVYDSVGALDAAFQAVRQHGRVTSALGWGTFSLAPLSFRSASYTGVFTLRPLLSGEGRRAHGLILDQARALVEQGKLLPRMDSRRFTLNPADAEAAYRLVESGAAAGKVVLEMIDGRTA
jgi:NADPH:quinone reductase-like Zn-dependent oxidoreductase